MDTQLDKLGYFPLSLKLLYTEISHHVDCSTQAFRLPVSRSLDGEISHSTLHNMF